MERYEHGGDVYSHENIVLDYSVNLNPLGMPERVKASIVSHMDAFASYPDTKCRALTRAIADREGIEAEHILCGNGAADLIFRICLARKPKRMLTLAPTFSEYERTARLCGSRVFYHRLYETEGFALTERLLDDITPDTDMLFLCNPNNPTGQLADRDLLVQIARRCMETDTFFMVDECFLPFTDGASLAPFLNEVPNLAILKAFTKLYAMAGLRLGYLLSGNLALVKAAGEHAPCWSVSSPAQTAGLAALNCRGWEEETRSLVAAERAYLSDALQSLGLTVFESDANFLLIKSSKPLYDRLLLRGILIRRCENYAGLNDRFYRLGVKRHAQNEMLVRAVKEVLHG